MFPECVNGPGMTGNTSKLVFGPLALSVMVVLTTPHSGLVDRKKHWFGYFCVLLKKTLLCDLAYKSLCKGNRRMYLCPRKEETVLSHYVPRFVGKS